MEAIIQQNNTDLPRIGQNEAQKRGLVDGDTLQKMHLMPTAAPVAFTPGDNGDAVYYFHPDKVTEAPPERWMKKPRPAPGTELTPRRADALGYYTAERLKEMYYEPTGDPVAYLKTRSGDRLPLYDRAECKRLPLPCVRCGAPERYRAKLCRACYQQDLSERRAAGDARRADFYGHDPRRVLYFDLEMTGVYRWDEILSVCVVDGTGATRFDTLIKPTRVKRWNRTEKIHGITPAAVKDAPDIAEVTPALTALLDEAECLIAFGTATDYGQLRRLYKDKKEQDALHDKMIDCAAEFSHYVYEHEIELAHHSLSDAMATLGLFWNGAAHTATADAAACRLVFETLFPHFYDRKEP